MKKFTTLSMVVASLLFVVACPAFGSIFANPQVDQTVYFTTEIAGENGGGPFRGHLSNGVTWDTFCVEADGATEWFVPNHSYDVLNTQSSTATASGNTVTAAAKWLYWMYGTNQSEITGGGFTYHDTSADRTALQEAIWQGVLTLASPGHPSHSLGLPRPGQTTGGTEPMTTEAWAWYDTAVAAVASNPEFLNYVYVVNPGPAPDGYYGFGEAQSMLYAHTPEPASIIVWSLIATVSYLGVTIWRRRARV